MMQKTVAALYALRAQCLAGSLCMIALCDLLVGHQTPDRAAQACTSHTKRGTGFSTAFGS